MWYSGHGASSVQEINAGLTRLGKFPQEWVVKQEPSTSLSLPSTHTTYTSHTIVIPSAARPLPKRRDTSTTTHALNCELSEPHSFTVTDKKMLCWAECHAHENGITELGNKSMNSIHFFSLYSSKTPLNHSKLRSRLHAAVEDLQKRPWHQCP